MTVLSNELHPTLCSHRSSCHRHSLEEADEFCRHGAFRLLWCLSHRERLTTKNSLGPSVLEVSNITQPFSSLASSRIRLKSTSVSSGPSRDSKFFNFHFHTFTFFQVLLRLCNDRERSAPPAETILYEDDSYPNAAGPLQYVRRSRQDPFGTPSNPLPVASSRSQAPSTVRRATRCEKFMASSTSDISRCADWKVLQVIACF